MVLIAALFSLDKSNVVIENPEGIGQNSDIISILLQWMADNHPDNKIFHQENGPQFVNAQRLLTSTSNDSNNNNNQTYQSTTDKFEIFIDLAGAFSRFILHSYDAAVLVHSLGLVFLPAKGRFLIPRYQAIPLHGITPILKKEISSHQHQYTEVETKRLLFCRKHFLTHFLGCELLDFDSNFTGICNRGPITRSQHWFREWLGEKLLSEPMICVYYYYIPLLNGDTITDSWAPADMVLTYQAQHVKDSTLIMILTLLALRLYYFGKGHYLVC